MLLRPTGSTWVSWRRTFTMTSGLSAALHRSTNLTIRLLNPSGSTAVLIHTGDASVLHPTGSTSVARRRDSVLVSNLVSWSIRRRLDLTISLRHPASFHKFRHGSPSSWLPPVSLVTLDWEKLLHGFSHRPFLHLGSVMFCLCFGFVFMLDFLLPVFQCSFVLFVPPLISCHVVSCHLTITPVCI